MATPLPSLDTPVEEGFFVSVREEVTDDGTIPHG
jgi:hypothetical protein